MKNKLPRIDRYQPLAPQVEYLAAWLAACEADRKLAAEQEGACACETSDRPLKETLRRPYDPDPVPGQVRLLAPRRDCDDCRPVYVAVLKPWDDDEWLIAPFSAHHVPALPGELLFGDVENLALRVLCLWNARTVTPAILARSWIETDLSPEQMSHAWDVFRHVMTGAALPESLVAFTGPRVLRGDDPRIEYQRAEMALLDRMTADLLRVETQRAQFADWLSHQNMEAIFNCRQLLAAADGVSVVTPCLILHKAETASLSVRDQRQDVLHAESLFFDPLIPGSHDPVCCEWRLQSGYAEIPDNAAAFILDARSAKPIARATVEADANGVTITLTQHTLEEGAAPIRAASDLRIVIVEACGDGDHTF